jgi:hypothetical protein
MLTNKRDEKKISFSFVMKRKTFMADLKLTPSAPTGLLMKMLIIANRNPKVLFGSTDIQSARQNLMNPLISVAPVEPHIARIRKMEAGLFGTSRNH